MIVQVLNSRKGPPSLRPFEHTHVMVGMRSDLGQVRHADDLLSAGKVGELATDCPPHVAADANVNLVQNQAANVRVGENRLDGQRDAGHLAAGGNPGQRTRRLALVRRNQNFDFVAARLIA